MPHLAVKAMQTLIPEAIVTGKSFAESLDHPACIARDRRLETFEAAQDITIKECIQDLFRQSGILPTLKLSKGAGGEPLWPPGFVGSLSHKGTLVIAAMASNAILCSLGIDIERVEKTNLIPIEAMIVPEGLPPNTDPSIGILLAFSAKEAVFKANYTHSGKMIDFHNVTLHWTTGESRRYKAEARIASGAKLEVRCAIVEEWVISSATQRQQK